MIEKFVVKNYKNLSLDEITFKKVNILIGANGSGKSNFIDSVVFFKDLIQQGLQQTIAKRKFDEILNKFDNENMINYSLSLNTETNYPTLKYEADIFIHQMRTYFFKENISYDKVAPNKEKPFNFIKCHDRFPNKGAFPVRKRDGQIYSQLINIVNTDTIFRQAEDLTKSIIFAREILPTFSKVIDDIKKYVFTWRYFSMSEIDLNELKKPLRLTGKINELNYNLSNFGDFIKFMVNSDIFIERIKDYFGMDVKFENSIQGEYIQFFPIFNDRKFLLSSLSDGQIRILLLLSILYLDKNSKVVFLDEPELNLHTSWLLKLKTDMYSSDKQLFISSHSADLLDSFTQDFLEDRVNILIFENGKIKILQKSEILLNEIDKGFELGDLYRSGDPIIGGWSI